MGPQQGLVAHPVGCCMLIVAQRYGGALKQHDVSPNTEGRVVMKRLLLPFLSAVGIIPEEHSTARSPSRIVIIGGGYAGTALAHALHKRYEVTLIDPKSNFENTMANPLVATGGGSTNHVAYSACSPEAHIVKDVVAHISEDELEAGFVRTENGKRVSFDVLVIASGSRTAVQFPNAVNIRDQQACVEALPRLKQSARIAVVGAGPAGVELVAELAEAYPEKSIYLIGGSRLLPQHAPSVGDVAAQALGAFSNVTLLFGNRAEKVHPTGDVELVDGTFVHADIAYMCTGALPNSSLLPPRFLDENGFVRVDEHLLVQGHQNVFAIGDVNNAVHHKLAGHAFDQAIVAKANIEALLERKPLAPYNDPRVHASQLISLGHRNCIVVPVDGAPYTSWLRSFQKNMGNSLSNIPFAAATNRQ